MLYVSTFLSHTSVFHCSPGSELAKDPQGHRLPLRDSGKSIGSSPGLQEHQRHLSNYLSHFNLTHDLGDTGVLKSWGLAISPIGGWIAACISVHPGDMVEYLTLSQQQSIISFSCPASATLASIGRKKEALQCMPASVFLCGSRS